MNAIEQAFLDDIVAHPDDPSLWLILADWLDDREDARGELVRLTWSLQYEPDHADFAKREARVQTLLAEGVLPVRPVRTLAGMDFVWIAPGSFLMGSPDDEKGRAANETQHRATFTQGFWLGVTLVTQGHWRTLIGENPSAFSRDGSNANHVTQFSAADLDRLPVESVSWNDVQRYCARFGELANARIDLPTEAQWEYACRAGTTTPFHFGTKANGREANLNGNQPYRTRKKGPYLERTHLVASYPPNAWGLYDMHGNLWEWCRDAWVDQLTSLPEVDPVGHEEPCERRALRGGAARAHAYRCRAAARLWYAPDRSYDHVGVRVCCRVD